MAVITDAPRTAGAQKQAQKVKELVRKLAEDAKLRKLV
jgi:hypothetical protein